MAQFTQKAIMESFIALLNKRPFEKVTVTDIVECSGISRSTFYYYYPDIYALCDELFRQETQRIIDAHRSYGSWQDVFLEVMHFAVANRQAVFHIYNSISRDRLERYIFDVSLQGMTDYVGRQAAGLSVSPEDIQTLAGFYTAALTGLALKWLGSGMKQDPEACVAPLSRLLDGDIRRILEQHAGDHAK